MKEMFGPGRIQATPEVPIVHRLVPAELTLEATRGYAGGGDIFMPESGHGESTHATKPTETSTLTRDNIVVLSEFRARNKDTLPVEVKGAIDNLLSEAIVSGAGSEGANISPINRGEQGDFVASEGRRGRSEKTERGTLLDEGILDEASKVSAGMASAAQSIKELGRAVAAGMSLDVFQERQEAMQKKLNDLLNPTSVQIKDGKLITPRILSEIEKNRHDAMQYALSHELAKLIDVYRSKELRRDEDEDKENPLAVEFHTAHENLDKLLGVKEENRDSDWEKAYNDAYDDIDRYITSLDYSNPEMRRLIPMIAAQSLSDGRVIGKDSSGNEVRFKDRRGKEHYGYALEHAIEMIIGQGDTNPTGDYPQFGLYQQGNLDDLLQASRKYSEGFFSYLYNLRSKRVLSHTLFQNLKDRKTLVEIVTRSLDPGGMRFIEDQIAGVPEILAFYEKELGRLTGSNSYLGRGWVQFDDYRDIADKTVQGMVNNGDLNLVKQIRNWEKNEQGVWEGKAVSGVTRKMRDWERSRAFHMARANTGATIRRQIWGLYGDNPDNIPDLVKSLEGGEMVAMIMAPLARLDNRYFSQPGSQLFINNWVERKIEEARRQEKRYSLSRNGEEYGLYGASVKSTVLLDTGVVDVKSSGWRNDLMFLRQKEYGVSENLSIDEFFTQKKNEFREQITNANPKYKVLNERVRDYKKDAKLKHELSHEVSHKFNHWLKHEGLLADQRLFLGVLARRSDISWENKMALWHTTADLLPSRIASLMPQFSMEEVRAVYGNKSDAELKAIWDSINRKLFLAEHDRVQADAEGFKWKKVVDKNTKVERWERADYTPEKLEEFIKRRGNMTPAEQRVVQRWQKLGHDMADQLAQMVWPHTPFLDDVPRTGWENMGRNELDRLLINDHNDWQEAYGQMTTIIANPAIDSPKLPELALKFVEHAKSPESLSEAQARLEAFIYTWCTMARKYTFDRLTADIRTAGPKRVATSMMMEFNLSSGISKDEEQIAGVLAALANIEALSDDPAEVDSKKRTQLVRLMYELDASRKDITVGNIYDVTLLIIFELLRKAIDTAIPDEVVKQAA